MVSLRQSYGPYFSYHEKIVCIFVKKISILSVILAAILDFRHEGLLRVTRIAVYSIQGV